MLSACAVQSRKGPGGIAIDKPIPPENVFQQGQPEGFAGVPLCRAAPDARTNQGPSASVVLRLEAQDAAGSPGGHAICDIWDFIHYRCPLSPLEAKVLVRRYVLCMSEREAAKAMGLDWKVLNRATWRLKAKLRAHLDEIRALSRSL